MCIEIKCKDCFKTDAINIDIGVKKPYGERRKYMEPKPKEAIGTY